MSSSSPGGSTRTVFHVLDWRDGGPVVAWSIGALMRHAVAGERHRVVFVGSDEELGRARVWLGGGGDGDDVVSVVVPRLTRSAVRGCVADGGGGDVVLAWSGGALRRCFDWGGRGGGRVKGLLGRRVDGGMRGRGWLVRAAEGGCVAFGSEWARAGSGMDGGAPVLPLPAPMVGAGDARRDRGWMGLEDADRRFVIAGVGWPGRDVCASRVSYICGVLAIGGHDGAAIVPCDASDLGRATLFAHRHDDAWAVFACDGSDARFVSCADVALWCGHGGATRAACGTLPDGVRSRRCVPLAESLLLPLALGIPVVSERVPATAELLGAGAGDDGGEGDGDVGWLTPAEDRLAMDRRVYSVMVDPAGARARQGARAAGILRSRDGARFAERVRAWLWDGV
ncbi:MAG: hypothetical protein ACTS3F_10510 [Phycisphaerales bacterium]